MDVNKYSGKTLTTIHVPCSMARNSISQIIQNYGLADILDKAPVVNVQSQEVDINVVKGVVPWVTTTTSSGGNNRGQGILHVPEEYYHLFKTFTILRAHGIPGYSSDTNTPDDKNLMLIVTGHNPDGAPVIRAINGKKTGSSITLPVIPKGTRINFVAHLKDGNDGTLADADIKSENETLFLQKNIISDLAQKYFDYLQGKANLDENEAKCLIAYIDYLQLRSSYLWTSVQGKVEYESEEMDSNEEKIEGLSKYTFYSTQGLKWRCKYKVISKDEWTLRKILAIAKLFFEEADGQKEAVLLAGSDLLMKLQSIREVNSPYISIYKEDDNYGNVIKKISTIYGDIDVKRDVSLDSLSMSSSGAIIDVKNIKRLVYNDSNDIYEALFLSQNDCIWIEDALDVPFSGNYILLWDKESAPEEDDVFDGLNLLLTVDCKEIGLIATAGTIVTAEGDASSAVWTVSQTPPVINYFNLV